jgi:hypothetical protein
MSVLQSISVVSYLNIILNLNQENWSRDDYYGIWNKMKQVCVDLYCSISVDKYWRGSSWIVLIVFVSILFKFERNKYKQVCLF